MISEVVLRKAAAACFKNAESHRGAALVLFNEDFRAQAVALAAIGTEEIAKSILYAVAALVPEQRKDVPSRIDGHAQKQFMALWAEVEVIESSGGLLVLAQERGVGVSEEESLAEYLTGLARSGVRKLLDAAPTSSEKREFRDQFSGLWAAMRQKDAALYVDLTPEGHLLVPNRVQDEAGSEINGLGWFLDEFAPLPRILGEDQAWDALARQVRRDLVDGGGQPPPDSN